MNLWYENKINRIKLIEDFLNSSRRSKATYELANYKEHALPTIIGIFDVTLKNKFNVPYRSFGEVLRCALITTRLIAESNKLNSEMLNKLIALISSIQLEEPNINEEATSTLRSLSVPQEL